MCETGGWAFSKARKHASGKMCVTVPYSANIVWVSCLYVLWEGAHESNPYRHMQLEKKWLTGRCGLQTYHTQQGFQRLYGSVFNLSVCAEQCVTPAAFYVFTVFNSWSYIILRLVWITAFLPFLHLAGKKKNVWIYFASLMSSHPHLSGKRYMSDCSMQSKGAVFQAVGHVNSTWITNFFFVNSCHTKF